MILINGKLLQTVRHYFELSHGQGMPALVLCNAKSKDLI